MKQLFIVILGKDVHRPAETAVTLERKILK
jgi:hypothetical protein